MRAYSTQTELTISFYSYLYILPPKFIKNLDSFDCRSKSLRALSFFSAAFLYFYFLLVHFLSPNAVNCELYRNVRIYPKRRRDSCQNGYRFIRLRYRAPGRFFQSSKTSITLFTISSKVGFGISKGYRKKNRAIMINDRIDGRVYGGRRGKTCDVKREYSIELHCSCKNGSRIEFLRSNIKIRKYILELTSNRKV